MTTIKSYTDISQSKKLAKILPLESADMTWEQVTQDLTEDFTWKPTIGLEEAIKDNLFSYRNGYILPCWSLASLLEEIPEVINFDDDESDYELKIEKENNLYYLSYGNILEYGKLEIEPQENFVDACYELILKLNELNLL